jgi:hypothetical protein
VVEMNKRKSKSDVKTGTNVEGSRERFLRLRSQALLGLAKIFNESGVPHTVQIDREGALANDVVEDWFASKQIHVVKTEVVLVRTVKEIDQLIEKQIGVEVTPAEVKQVTEKGLRILQCKMVYKRKYHIGEDGKERFLKWKSRLAGVGSSEREGWETVYSTFSPTVVFSVIRLLISLTVAEYIALADMICEVYAHIRG